LISSPFERVGHGKKNKVEENKVEEQAKQKGQKVRARPQGEEGCRSQDHGAQTHGQDVEEEDREEGTQEIVCKEGQNQQDKGHKAEGGETDIRQIGRSKIRSNQTSRGQGESAKAGCTQSRAATDGRRANRTTPLLHHDGNLISERSSAYRPRL